MPRPAKQIFERLGTAGLSRSLDDLLDQNQLARLATNCNLKYPGMRTKTQTRGRLLADLVAKAAENETARRAILHTLRKETAQAAKDWSALEPAKRAALLGDEEFLLRDSNVGLHLFLIASSPDDSGLSAFAEQFATRDLVRLAKSGAAGTTEQLSTATREETRLRRKLGALEKKVRHVDAQLTKSREMQRTLKRDLIQRKGDLAESRMLTERLRRDLVIAQTAAQVASVNQATDPVTEKAIQGVAKAVRKLDTGQRKLAHEIGKRAAAPPAPKESNADTVALVRQATEQLLAKGFDRQKHELTKELTANSRRIEELRSDLRKRDEASGRRSPRRSRAKGAGARVGVFIDVQNVYYGARRLKGKLDFDALLQAAVLERRLIQATAYVVESKEIDQSQFIARLQQRAIKVQRKALKVRADGSMKGDWDMELALDVLDAAPDLDVVVLVSGDGDFTSLVKRVKTMGPRVEVIGFPRNTAKSLIEAADHHQPLDRKFMIYKRSPEPTKRSAKSEETAGESRVRTRSR